MDKLQEPCPAGDGGRVPSRASTLQPLGDAGTPDCWCPQGPGSDGCRPPRLSPAPAPRRAGERRGAADGANMEALSRIQKAAARQSQPLSPWRGPSAPAQNGGSILQVWHRANVGSSQGWSCPPNIPLCPAPASQEHRWEPATPPPQGLTQSIPGDALAHADCIFWEQEEGRPPSPARQHWSTRPRATVSPSRRHRCRDTLWQPPKACFSCLSASWGATHPCPGELSAL